MRRWIGLMAAVAVLVAGACGEQRSASEVVLASASKSAQATSSKVAFDVTIQGVTGLPGGGFTSTGEGAFDYARNQGAFTMTVPPVAGVDLGRIDAVSTGTTVYQKFPPQLAGLIGKPWAKLDLAAAGSALGIDISSISQASSSDPEQVFLFLRGSGQDMAEVGEEELRGTDVTHYKGNLDLAKAAASAPPEQQKALQQVAQLFAQPIPAEIWVDGDDQVRKVSYVVDLSRLNLPAEARAAVGSEQLTGTMSVSIEFFEFGAPVTVTVPPPDQVADLNQLLQQLRQAAQSERGGRRR